MDAPEFFERIDHRDVAAVLAALEEDPALALARHRGLGSTPLHFAAHRGLDTIVRALLAHGAAVDARETVSGTTPLHWAAEGGHRGVADALLAAGASLDAKDEWFALPPLGWATIVEWNPRFRDDRPATVATLLEAGAFVGPFEAIGLRRADALRAALDADPGGTGRRLGFVARGATPLHVAAALDASDLVDILLRRGADALAPTTWGISPRAEARRHWAADVERRLAEHGAPDDAACALVARDPERLVERLEALAPADAGVVTALLFEASGTGVEAAIPVLARHGAEVDRATPFLLDERPADVTPLHLAANAGHAGTVRALLHAGAAPSPGATTGLATPLHLAARQGDVEATRALVAAGADLDAKDPCFGATPIQWAEFGGREEAAAVLREAGAERE